jgi:hypothetical protein
MADHQYFLRGDHGAGSHASGELRAEIIYCLFETIFQAHLRFPTEHVARFGNIGLALARIVIW